MYFLLKNCNQSTFIWIPFFFLFFFFFKVHRFKDPRRPCAQRLILKYYAALAPAAGLSVCLCLCSNASKLSPKSAEGKLSHGALFFFFYCFLVCQFRDSSVDRRRTCCCKVSLICRSGTVIVSFCSDASELIRTDSRKKLCSPPPSPPSPFTCLACGFLPLQHVRCGLKRSCRAGGGSSSPDTSVKR